jgi:hypothetical protein
MISLSSHTSSYLPIAKASRERQWLAGRPRPLLRDHFHLSKFTYPPKRETSGHVPCWVSWDNFVFIELSPFVGWLALSFSVV